jgi:hypothetical protein
LGCPDGRPLGGAELTRSSAAGHHAPNEKDGGCDAERARHLLLIRRREENRHLGECSGMTLEATDTTLGDAAHEPA